MSRVFNPLDFGAVPTEDAREPVDARPGIQAAIDACVAAGGGDVYLGDRTWYLTRAPAGSYDRFSCLSWHGAGVRLVGEGARRCTLVVSGDAGARALHVISLDPGASDAELSGFTIDTRGLRNTDAGEQTHAIVIGSGVYTPTNGTDRMPVRDVVVHDVRFLHRGPAGERWGDAVRVGGNTELTPVINCRLLDLDVLMAGRSGIAMQRNVRNLLIRGCFFDGDGIGGTCVDGEATGGGWDDGLVIDACQFVRTTPGGDNFAISMTSQDRFAVTGCVIRGRGISLVRCTNGVLDGNVVDTYDEDTVGVVDLANACRDVVISDNVLHRRGKNGAVIKLFPHSGWYPEGVTITGNAITTDTDGAAVLAVGASDVVLGHNRLRGAGAGIGAYSDAGLRPVAGLVVTGNLFRGFGYAAARLAGRGYSSTVISGNAATACGPGLRVDHPGDAPDLVTGGNAWGTP